MSNFLRIAALACLAWAVLLFCAPATFGLRTSEPAATGVASGLAIAHLGWALALWRAAGDPARDRSVVYATLLVLGLRAVKGTYEVLYVLEGTPALVSLTDMVTSLALFVAILNALPGVLRHAAGENIPPSQP